MAEATAIPDPPFMELPSGAYSCNVCFKQILNYNNAKKHMLTHTGFKPFACFKCEFSCAAKFSLQRHCDAVHGISKEYFETIFKKSKRGRKKTN